MISVFKNTIKWPTANNVENIIHNFTCLWSLPYLDKVIRVIDESHIKIHLFVEHSDKYINHKKFYSLVLLDIVDANEKFTYTVYIQKSQVLYMIQKYLKDHHYENKLCLIKKDK